MPSPNSPRKHRWVLAAAGALAGLVLADLAAGTLAPLGAYKPFEMGGTEPTLRPSGLLGWERAPAPGEVHRDGFRLDAGRGESGAYKVLFVGDSLTDALTGRFLGARDSLLRRLSAAVGRPVEVWDFSAGGYNVEHYLRVLERRARGLAPDCVVVVFCLNDLDRLVPVVVRKGGGLHIAAPPLEGGATYRPWLLRSSRLYQTWFYRRLDRLRRRDASPEAVLADALPRLTSWAEARGARLLFVLFPYFKPPSDYTPKEARAREVFLSALSGGPAPFLWLGDALPPRYWEEFRDAERPWDTIHPGPDGYLAAEARIVDFLESELKKR